MSSHFNLIYTNPKILQVMKNSNPNHVAYIFIFIFLTIISSLKLSFCTQNHSIFCPEIEKQSLLNLKQSLKDPNNQLSSWETELNCCKWKGVVCSNSSGHVHVHHLHLHGFKGQLNPSLINLKHLTFLDLSRNNFQQKIPSFIGSFKDLSHLNLSDAGFHGEIPPTIGNLSRLHSLSISGNLNVLSSDNLEWLSELSELQNLAMDFVDIGKSRNWLQVITSLPSLKELRFKNCSIESFHPLINGVNMSSLSHLDLSYNNFHSLSIPPWIFHLSDLLHLDLSFAKINGPIPTMNNATKLEYIDLSQNPLNSTVPDWIYSCRDLQFLHFSYSLMHGGISGAAVANLTSLKTLNFFGNQLSGEIPPQISHMCGLEFLFLTYNQFHGDVSDSFGNMSDCFLESIKLLCVRSNHLHGRIPEGFGEFKRIQFLHFGGNSFSGGIPASLGKLSSLQELSLYGNAFSGSLPESFGQLSSLEEIYIDDCMLEGIITENHFSSLKRFKILSAPGNFLTLDVKPDWVTPFQLVAFKVASWRFAGAGGRIPAWIESQRNLSELDLSDTGISGTVPAWFWEIPFLNLSLNGLHGEIPNLNRARYLYLSSNSFNGSLPSTGGGSLIEIDLSNNSFSGGISRFLCSSSRANRAEILHLAGNKLNGELPDCWEKWASLKYLNLGNNSLYGRIPNSLGFLKNLQSLNLYRNKHSGGIPSSIRECRDLVKMELSENDLDGNFPSWIGTRLLKLRILILRSNSFNGEIPLEICHLISLQILDLSRNNFNGGIPKCVNNFSAMATKRSLDKNGYSSSSSSYNGASFIDSALVATKGSILQYDTILSLVTNMDLSSNDLSGVIPSELTSLVELRSLNLSRNGLIGSIPRDIGNMKELESLDLSRNFLSSQIPSSLSSASFLNHLDLSYNNLSGRIPKSTQIQSFDSSSFVGNDLCGPPLATSCSDEGRGEREERDGDGDGVEVNWLYVLLSSGYVVGFGVVCSSLLLNKRWRDAYFGLFFKR